MVDFTRVINGGVLPLTMPPLFAKSKVRGMRRSATHIHLIISPIKYMSKKYKYIHLIKSHATKKVNDGAANCGSLAPILSNSFFGPWNGPKMYCFCEKLKYFGGQNAANLDYFSDLSENSPFAPKKLKG